MAHRLLRAADSHWRPSNQMSVQNTDLGRQLEASGLGMGSVRQIFNDTDADQLWLVAGAPPKAANTVEMTEEQLAELYPDGPQALPPELAGG